MKKKILAGALASVMAIATAASVSAIESTLDCTGWWTAHTSGVEITAEGIEITFDSKTYDDAGDNWNSPIYVVYSSPDASIKEAGDEGYTEYFVGRADMYGWNSTGGNTNDGLGDGWTWTRDAEPDWDNWLDNNVAGVSGTLKATKGDGTVTVVFTVNGGTSTVVIPVTDDTVYVALSGEKCTLSNIKLTVNEPAGDDGDGEEPDDGDGEEPDDGDGDAAEGDGSAAGDTDNTPSTSDKNTPDTGIEGVAVVAGLAIVAAGAVVVAKKRK